MATHSYTPPNAHQPFASPRASMSLLPPEYPPAPRRCLTQTTFPPLAVGPSGYTSPDPSPTEDRYAAQTQPAPGLNRSYSFSQSDYFDRRNSTHPPPLPDHRDHGPPGPRGSYEDRRDALEVDPFYYPVLPRSMETGAQKRRVSKKSDGKQPTFLTKLYQYVAPLPVLKMSADVQDPPDYAHIIRWDEAGEVIIIEKPDELADKILPLVYRQSRFASFSRQLNIYGFMRKVSLRHVDRGICDPDASIWSHPFLRRSSTPAEIQGFKRRVPPRPSQAVKRRASLTSYYHDDRNPGLGLSLSPTSSEGSYQSPPDAYQQHLLPHVEEDRPSVFADQNPNDRHDAPFQAPASKPYPSFSLDRSMFSQSIAMPVVSDLSPRNFEYGRNVNAGIPASAPAHIAAFPGSSSPAGTYGSLGMLISQGHIRTRSVQGEPPSATLFSPSSPLANPGWMPSSLGQQARDEMSPIEPSGADLKEDSSNTSENMVPPTYHMEHPSALVRPTGLDRLGIAPSSLPNDFAPSYISPGAPTSMDAVIPSTVSPGIYQHGFLFASMRSTQGTTPRAVPTKTERRASMSGFGSSPYSPRSRVGAATGTIRGIGSNSREGSHHGSLRDRLSHRPLPDVYDQDDALPSAGLRLNHTPFEGILPEDAPMDG